MKSGGQVRFRIIAVIVGLMLGGALAEVGLRIAVYSHISQKWFPFAAFMGQQEEAAINDSPLFRASQNPLIAFELTPNIRNSYIRINSDGFRGPDYSFVVPAGRRRIAVLGDSETFGMSMPEEATLPGKLQILLNSRSVEPFEVLNFGVPAYNSIQELQILEAKVLKYNPEIVILYYNFNDPIISPRSMLISRTVFHKLFLVSFVDWALSRRKTANEIGEHYSKIVLQGSTDADSMVDFYLALHKGSYFETTKSLLKKMAKISKQHGSRFILVIAPELYDFDDFSKYPYRSIHAALKALVSPEIEVVDPLDDVIALGKKPGDLWVSNTDPHKNQEAQASVAKAITRYLNNTK